jgi:deoxyribodipyrimidine photo-lyase
MIQEQRIRALNDASIRKGDYVLYWMQQSQRAECNHALEYAIERANGLKLPVIVFFGITGSFPEANARHLAFMLRGLRRTGEDLARRGILFAPRVVSPERGAVEMAKRAALAVTDRGYLRVQREWRVAAAGRVSCPLIQVESDVVVPVETASPKEEYTAGTFRPKLSRLLYAYLKPLKKRRVAFPSLDMTMNRDDIADIDAVVRRVRADRSVAAVSGFRGGTGEAKALLKRFIANRLDRFDDLRNDPGADWLSGMSPYLHFGQISPLQVALAALASGSAAAGRFIEELVVRRELAMNFVHYNPHYDRYECLPDWAKATLRKHARDRREYVYSRDGLERGETHDRYWNAAQRELAVAGKMHGYMRMYWGKKILEWSRSPEEAYGTALYLNNKYSVDGRDPNGFAGVAWCFGKHDRAWPERAVFGKVRFMNDRGLERKFDMDTYCARVDGLA